MKVNDPDFLRPSRIAFQRLQKELFWIGVGFVSIFAFFGISLTHGYTTLAQKETKDYGISAYSAILNYAQDNDEILPSGFLDITKLSEKIAPYSTGRTVFYTARCPRVELSPNPTLSSKSISTLDPKTELFTITNKYIWNNYKVIHYLDGSTLKTNLE